MRSTRHRRGVGAPLGCGRRRRPPAAAAGGHLHPPPCPPGLEGSAPGPPKPAIQVMVAVRGRLCDTICAHSSPERRWLRPP
eukprot:5953575-Pleurochrysis_carterae.AAC.1